MSDLDNLGGNGSLIQGNPEDKGVGQYGGKVSEPEKHSQLMEFKRKLLERKNADVDESVVKEIEKRIKKGELSKISLDRLIDKAIKMRPQRTESKVEHTGSFAHWVLKVKKEEEKYNTIDAD